jgi:hypothetical protein
MPKKRTKQPTIAELTARVAELERRLDELTAPPPPEPRPEFYIPSDLDVQRAKNFLKKRGS